MPNDLSAPDVAGLTKAQSDVAALIERLRATKTQVAMRSLFGGGIALPDPDETREVLINPDGPEAANLINTLTRPQATPAEALAAYQAYRAPETPHGISTADQASEIEFWTAAYLVGSCGRVDGVEADLALREATALANSLWSQHFRERAPNWKPLPDLRGVISQIDNMTTALKATPETPVEPVGARVCTPADDAVARSLIWNEVFGRTGCGDDTADSTAFAILDALEREGLEITLHSAPQGGAR